ncbi:hypothetical protein ABEB36_012899 [Hypothenemus hampei]|uniref:Phosphatidylinositol N-acetylglucosaminyltransferase subunit C n=1 Tax=Hypothenemus hampei TaxID=57062 RepID=A0ABD1E6F6_HYPHA
MPPEKAPWEKILYKKQDYPDNYTDPTIFLKDLKKNVYFKEVTFLETCLGATLLLQECCFVILFTLIYWYMVNKWVDPSFILYSSCGINFIGFVFYRHKQFKHRLGYDIRTTLTFIAFGQLFSPVLHTLTDTISTDTIYTMAFLMMIVHLIFFDYEIPAAIVSRSLSTSAAMFASICLASRLSSASEVFVFVTVATQIFVLSPSLRKLLSYMVSLIITAILFLVNSYFLNEVSFLGFLLFCVIVGLIVFVFPLLYVKYQVFKDNIYGPWDEAIVKNFVRN